MKESRLPRKETSRSMTPTRNVSISTRNEKNAWSVSYCLHDCRMPNAERFVVEERFEKPSLKRKRDQGGDHGPQGVESETSSSESEDEDDVGELATTALDSEILATLNAIKAKDPRVYDTTTTFYSAGTEDGINADEKPQKPMFLKDYHRENLLTEMNGSDHADMGGVPTYDQEQTALRDSIVGEINTIVPAQPKGDESSDEEFLLSKPLERKPAVTHTEASHLDVENADKDPETYLSNFLASRAWVPEEDSKFQPLDSDDDDEERKAEEFEEAYNFRFEDAQKSNEKLQSHARDIAAKFSVRRDEKNSRQKRRDRDKESKDATMQELRAEKARLRKLKIEEAEEKVRRIKRAGGLSGPTFSADHWMRIVNEDWTDSKWEEEMSAQFGISYYNQDEVDSENDEQPQDANAGKRMLKKPKWEDDVDINDLVPDFDNKPPGVDLTEDEDGLPDASTPRKQGRKAGDEAKKEAKKDRRIIEALVDQQLHQDPTLKNKTGSTSRFRYRDTSPNSFGMSARDILLANDAQLNEYAGLKKLAAFRDPEKKQKDKKRLGKKARLRQWRKETFGHEDGLPQGELPLIATAADVSVEEDDEGADIRSPGKRKRRRGRKAT